MKDFFIFLSGASTNFVSAHEEINSILLLQEKGFYWFQFISKPTVNNYHLH
jgi:hypothetical protein